MKYFRQLQEVNQAHLTFTYSRHMTIVMLLGVWLIKTSPSVEDCLWCCFKGVHGKHIGQREWNMHEARRYDTARCCKISPGLHREDAGLLQGLYRMWPSAVVAKLPPPSPSLLQLKQAPLSGKVDRHFWSQWDMQVEQGPAYKVIFSWGLLARCNFQQTLDWPDFMQDTWTLAPSLSSGWRWQIASIHCWGFGNCWCRHLHCLA